MAELLSGVRSQFEAQIASAASSQDVEAARLKFLGKKGELTALLKGLGNLPSDERPQAGQIVNEAREEFEAVLKKKKESLLLQEEEELERVDWIDVTLPGCGREAGVPHPVVQTMAEVVEIFVSLGYSVEVGPEIETDFYNFEALNFEPHHPARDMQDTFFVQGDRLLRTHTSPVQIRTMQKIGSPIRAVFPGRVYRRDNDPTHSPMFHQLEGLLLDENVSVADLKGSLQVFVEAIFGRPLSSRWRASYFPFTEPSLEMDVECVVCGGKNPQCRVCKGTGYLEILGAGMVHPNVVRAGGLDPERVNGYAWGLGIDRVAMLKYGITDLRLLFEGDMAFLKGRR